MKHNKGSAQSTLNQILQREIANHDKRGKNAQPWHARFATKRRAKR